MSRGPRPNDIVDRLIYFFRQNPQLIRPALVIAAVGVLVIALVVGFVLLSGGLEALRLPAPPVPATQREEGTEREPQTRPTPAESGIHLTMGNPSDATDDPDHPDNFLMRKPYYALSYNNAKGTPNWVSWRLRADDLGHVERGASFQQGPLSFRPDPELLKLKEHQSGWQAVRPQDYAGTGFDRGHMCPFADRTSSEEAAASTFLMSNMIPQSPHCNQRAWADLEDYCRDLVRKKHQTLYIVSGPAGVGGEGSKGREEVIPNPEKGTRHSARVTVPAKCWKVVLALADGKGDAEDVNRVSRDSRVFAVVMPNDQSVGHGWAKYRTSAKEVESLTDYKFFDRVPAAIIDPLKEQVDREHIPAERHKKDEG
jgi:endonuclease G